MSGLDPSAYEAWYHSPRGRWIGDTEFALLRRLLRPAAGQSLLDVGCGTGHFSRRFAQAGLDVTAVDPDERMLDFARAQGGGIRYLHGDALSLPFADHSFDHCAAITSLCFIDKPELALREMLRVCRHSVLLGLLNRRSRLYSQKQGRGAYRGARWDSIDDVRRWLPKLTSSLELETGTAIFFPGGNQLARTVERWLPDRLPWGGFLAVKIKPVSP